MRHAVIRLLKPLVERFPKLAMAYRLVQAHWQLMDEPQPTALGFKFVGNKAMQQGLFEVEETALVKALLLGVDVLLNVGANIGYYCCIAAKMNKRVLAFEPVALNLQYLIKNIEANRWSDRVEIFPLALSDRQGAVKIYGGGTGASLVKGWAKTPQQYPTLVAAATMDAVLGSRFRGTRCLVLIDIEGAEKSMLDGAQALLNMEPKPIWLVEITVAEHQPTGVPINPGLAATFKTFWDRGYEAWTATRQSRRILPEDIDRVLRGEQPDLSTHNFLFVEPGKNIWPRTLA